MNRKTIRKTKTKSLKPRKPSSRVKAVKRKEFRELPFAQPELRWVDAVLRSFHEEAPPAWVPFTYQAMLKKHARRVRKPRVLH